MYRRKRYNSVNCKSWVSVNPLPNNPAPRSNQKPALGQRSTSRKHVTAMSCKLEPAIWSRDTDQRIPCFGRCQLIITWMSNIKEVHGKPRLSTYYLEYGRHIARLRRHRRAYAPTSSTAIHDNHEEMNLMDFLFFPL